jgi:hypothetical protein
MLGRFYEFKENNMNSKMVCAWIRYVNHSPFRRVYMWDALNRPMETYYLVMIEC